MLNVRLSAERIRSDRTRMAAFGLGMAFATIFVFYILWLGGQMLMNRFVYRNPQFAVRTIEIQSSGVLTKDQLRRLSGIKPGNNLIALNLGRVKRDMEAVSQIKSVTVERELPGILRLRVVEREPVAEAHIYRARKDASLETLNLNLDSEGSVFTLQEPNVISDFQKTNQSSMTVITGIDPAELVPGHRVLNHQAQLALDLIRIFKHSPMQGLVELRSIDVSDPDVLRTYTSEGSEIAFGSVNLDRQLRRWREIYNQGQRLSRVLATLDLSLSNGIPATWAEVTPQIPAPKQNQRNKGKKND